MPVVHRLAPLALLVVVALPARAVDSDSLRLAKDVGGVRLAWTDATPTVACVTRDPAPPPVTLLQEVAGLTFVDGAPSVPLLFYDVSEPAGGTCGAPPARCASAGTLACGVTLSSANDAAGSTNVVDTYGGCAGSDASGPEIAFELTATESGTHDVTLTNAPAGLDVRVLRSAAGTCDPAQCIAFGDTGVSFGALAGESFFVVVDGQAGVTGAFDVRVSCPVVTGGCAPVATLSCGATDSRNTGDAGSLSVLVDHPSCFATGLTGREMVYSFVPSADDTIEARLTAGATVADILVLEDAGAGCETASCLAYGDSVANAAVIAGRQYFIVVDSASPTGVTYDVALSCRGAQCQPDQSLLCGQAIAHSNAWPVFTDVNDSYPCSPNDYSGPEYSFRFTATQDGQATATLSNMTAELDVFVTEEVAGCSPASCIAFGDTVATFNLVGGTTYDVIVDGRNGEEGFFRIDLSCTVPPSACDPHGVIRCGDLVGNDSAAGRDQVDAYPACGQADETGPEYVFLYAPTEDVTARVVMDLAVEDLDIMVVQDQGAGCSPDDCIASGDTEVSFDAAAGQVYYVIVDGKAGVSDVFRLWMDCQRVPGACRPAQAITCGQTATGRNDAPGSTDAIDLYDCLPYPEEGPELTYSFTPSTDGTARVTLSNLSGDLDVFVLRDDGLGCNQQSCVGGANATLDVAVVAGATYYIVVEGYAGSVGGYDLTLECL